MATAMRTASHIAATACAVALASGLVLTLPVSDDTVASLLPAGNLGLVSPAQAQPSALSQSQSEALAAYNKAVGDFRSILKERRAQIDAMQPLPNVPGQALYLARNNMISAYKDLTDTLPSRIGRPNKFAIPRPTSTPTTSRCSTSMP